MTPPSTSTGIGANRTAWNERKPAGATSHYRAGRVTERYPAEASTHSQARCRGFEPRRPLRESSGHRDRSSRCGVTEGWGFQDARFG